MAKKLAVLAGNHTVTTIMIFICLSLGCEEEDPFPDSSSSITPSGTVGACVPFEPYKGYSTCVGDKRQLGDQFGKLPTTTSIRPLTKLPAKVNFRQSLDKCTKVHNQGSCLWCVAHATTGMLEAMLCKTYGLDFTISEPHLWYLGQDGHKQSNWAGFNSCKTGWLVDAAFEKLLIENAKSNYLVPGTLWPFSTSVKTMNDVKPSNTMLTQGGLYGLTDNLKVPGQNVIALKTVLAQGYPVVYEVPVFKDSGWECGWIKTKLHLCPANWGKIDIPLKIPDPLCLCSCPIDSPDCRKCTKKEPNCVMGFHAILITGYDDSNGGWFNFKNSYGTSWADAGYGQFSYDFINDYGQGGRYTSSLKLSYNTNPKPDSGVVDQGLPDLKSDAHLDISIPINDSKVHADLVQKQDKGGSGNCGLAISYNGKSQGTCGGGFENCLNFFYGFLNCICFNANPYTACEAMLKGGYSESECKSGNFSKAQLISKMQSHLTSTSKWSITAIGDCSGYPN